MLFDTRIPSAQYHCYPADHPPQDQQHLNIEFDGTTVLCRVCGDKASGFHYGVHSCEGCKGFFRRSIQQKIQYRPCTKNQQCSILRINRNRCQYCRLKKCIAVGMSRDAVRFGRVPKREKARILAAMQQSTNSRSQEKAVAAELEDDQKLLRAVIGAHLETCEFTRDKVQPMLLKARDQPSYTACPPTLACPLNPNPQPLTGQQELLQDFSKRFSPAIRGVVEFAKRIPGFSHLTQEDQVTLLKAGVFEVLLVRLACMFDTQNNSMICLNGQVLKRESIHTSSNARFLMDSMFDFAERLNSLRLSDAEIGLFSSIVVIAADRPGLRNTDLIEKMHNKLKAVLQLVIGQNHPGQPNLCQELMKKIPDLRTLNTLHSEKLLAFKMTEQQQQLAQQQQQQQSSTTSSSSSWVGVSMMVEDESKSPGGSSSWSSSSDVAMEEVKSPLGSVSSTESVCSGEVASLSEYPGGAQTASAPLLAATLAGGLCPHRHRANSGSTSGDEIKDIKPVVLHHHRGFGRKLDSPSDSGIESGTEKLEKHPGSAPTSVCSSPRSSVEDKEDQSHQAHVEDMPVLKRVLQAPPLYDTNSLMDEAYKPHKKFRALRNKDCAEAESAGAAIAEHHRPQHHHRVVAAPSPAITARTPPPQQMMVHQQQPQQTSSLSSTHSTLAKSLMEVPRMTPEQMKRTDIIHNYIMRGSVEGPYGGGGGSSPQSHSHSRWPTNGTSVITTTSRAVAAGYPPLYVQQHHPHHHHHQQQQHSPSVSPCPSSSSTASAASCSSSSSSSTSSSSSSSSSSSAVAVGAGGQCPSSSPLGGVVELQVGTQPLNLSKKTPPPSPRPGPVSAPKALSLEA